MLGGGSASCIELWIYLESNRVVVITSQAILIGHYYVFVIMTMKGLIMHMKADVWYISNVS